jgi:hypothetical protein
LPVLGVALDREGGAGSRFVQDYVRRLALGIIRERRASGMRTFVLTAVREGAGTTSLALALAKELGWLGLRTIVIEANAVSPDARYPAAQASSRRLANPSHGLLLRDGASGRTGQYQMQVSEVARSVRFGQSGGAGHHATSVTYHAGAHEVAGSTSSLPERIAICRHNGEARLERECMKDSIDRSLTTHDIVLIDAPSMLASADAEMLIQMPAGALLVVRADRDLEDEVAAIVRRLEKLDPPVIGVVMSRVPESSLALNPAAPLRPIHHDSSAATIIREWLGV